MSQKLLDKLRGRMSSHKPTPRESRITRHHWLEHLACVVQFPSHRKEKAHESE